MVRAEILDFFSKIIEEGLGIVYTEANHFQLAARIEEITPILGFDTVEDFYSASKINLKPEVQSLLFDTATNNETSFFRDNKPFHALRKILLEKVEKGSDHFTFWCAASSTGQEPLSISLLLQDVIQETKKDIHYRIDATDVSDRVLKKAKLGQYNKLEVSRGLSDQHKSLYFKRIDDDLYQASDTLMKPIHYKFLNLKDAFPFHESFDFVFCRNVLIYQEVSNKISVLDKITQVLNKDGYLILGSGESLYGLTTDYAQVDIDGAIIYQKK